MMKKNAVTQRRLEWVLDALSLGAVLQYCAFRFLQSTMFNFYYSNTYKLITMGLLLVFGGIRWIYIFIQKWKEKDKGERKIFLLFCGIAGVLALPFFYVGWKHDYKFLVFLPVCCMCLYDMEAEKVFKAFSYVIGTLVVATLLCCLSGTVRNLVTPWGRRFFSSYGSINSSDFASYVTYILLVFWCATRNKKAEYTLLFAFCAIGISITVYWYTVSRTALYCGVLITVFAIWDSIRDSRRAKLRKGMAIIDKAEQGVSIIAFPACCISLIILVALYEKKTPWVLKLDDFLSFRIKNVWDLYTQYGVLPFGSVINQMHGNGATILPFWSSGYRYIDIAYAMLAIRYGWIISLIVLSLWVYMTIKAIKNGKRRIALSLFVLAIHALSETRVLDINYNILLAMPFCSMKSPLRGDDIKKDIQNKRKTILIILGLLFSASIVIVLPRLLSWFRTFFSLMGWNNGTNAIASLVTFIVTIVLISIIVYEVWHIALKLEIKHFAYLLILLLALSVGFITINCCIEQGRNRQIDRIKTEEPIIYQVQKVATQPVYASENSEIYQRIIGGFTEHIFSTDELGRKQKGSIFVDSNIEAFGITTTGGMYTQISEWSGLYSYDPEVISQLADKGYTWKTFYDGKRNCDMKDVALFNGMKIDNRIVLTDGMRIITKNMEIDQFAGKYEIDIKASLLSISKDDAKLYVEILGEAGETEICRKIIEAEQINNTEDGKIIVEYEIGYVPKVCFGISVSEGCSVSINEISWKRLQ